MVKQVEREADHWLLSTAETKNEWSYTSTPPIRLHGVHKNNFTVTFIFTITFTVTFTFNFTFAFTVTSNFTFTSTECQSEIVALLCRVRESRVEISDHGRAILGHMSVCPSLHMYRHGSHWTDFCEIWYCELSENLPTKSIFYCNRTKISGRLQEDVSKRILLFPETLNRHKSGFTAPNQQNPQTCSLDIYI